MVRSLANIEKELRELSESDQSEMLRVLIEELDGPPDPDVEKAWLEEVERRAAEIDSGAVSCVPAEEVFKKIDAQLKK